MTPPLRILCFGASITTGWYRGGLAFHPYAIRLKSRLQEQLPSTKIEIDVDGSPGDTVIGNQYTFRLKARQKLGLKYDWVIIQGGGNDLLQGIPPARVYEQLKSIWSMVLDSGSKVLALTITETADRRPQVRNLYDALNKMIEDHEEEGYEVADVCGALPWSNDLEEQKKIWDDGLHFTPWGYDLIGETVASCLPQLCETPTPFHARI